MFDIFWFLNLLHRGSNQNIYFDHSSKIFIFRSVELSQLSSFIISLFFSIIFSWARTSVIIGQIFDGKYTLQHSRNLFYHLQVLIHHLQVIRHEHPSCLNLIIKTSLQIKKKNNTSNTDYIHSCVRPQKKSQCLGHI